MSTSMPAPCAAPGIPALTPEQRIRYSTRQGMKGIEVDRIELA